MTREEAKEILTHNWTRVDNPNYSESELDEAFFMAIEALHEVQKHEETFEWCTDCKEYDKDNYCCHRWSKMIRNTVEELKEYSGLVRCKDCRHHGMRDCPVWGDDTTEDYMWCYCGERREP